MRWLRINGQPVEVAAGATILAAARQVGVDIPTLCWREGYECSTSCMVCAVKVAGRPRLLPACATPVESGMDVTTDDDEVRQHRREVLELLLSEHTGECDGPCHVACPAHLDAPRMLRAVQRGEWAVAAALGREALVLPESLGLACPAPCEKACRRAQHDSAVAIRELHRTAARRQRADASIVTAPGSRAAGLPVTIVGAGPAGLAAAAVLARRGWPCLVLDQCQQPGGGLRRALADELLMADALTADVAGIAALGVQFRLGTRVGSAADLERLRAESAAVLLAMGAGSAVAELGLDMTGSGLRVERTSSLTSLPGVFGAGGVVREITRTAVRAVASGKTAAAHIDAWLRGTETAPGADPIRVRLGRLRDGELVRFLADASPAPRCAPAAATPLADDVAQTEASRCLHCDCRAAGHCALRTLATGYGASPHRWQDTRRTVEVDASHDSVVYEPGKCIACGLCAQAAARAGERYGSTFLWRGINVRIGVPLGETMAAALTSSAAECVAVCPTGALAWKRD